MNPKNNIPCVKTYFWGYYSGNGMKNLFKNIGTRKKSRVQWYFKEKSERISQYLFGKCHFSFHHDNDPKYTSAIVKN